MGVEKDLWLIWLMNVDDLVRYNIHLQVSKAFRNCQEWFSAKGWKVREEIHPHWYADYYRRNWWISVCKQPRFGAGAAPLSVQIGWVASGGSDWWRWWLNPLDSATWQILALPLEKSRAEWVAVRKFGDLKPMTDILNAARRGVTILQVPVKFVNQFDTVAFQDQCFRPLSGFLWSNWILCCLVVTQATKGPLSIKFDWSGWETQIAEIALASPASRDIVQQMWMW